MKNQGQLLTRQAAARYLGVTKREVDAMSGEGLLKSVQAGGREYITARSIAHILGCEPAGGTAPEESGRYTALTFEAYAVKVLNSGVKRARSRTTNNYRQGAGVLAEFIGRRKIAEITEADLRAAFRRISGKYAKSSLRLICAGVRAVFAAAYKAGDIPSDPTAFWEPERSTKPRREEPDKVYSQQDVEELLRTSRAYSTELYTMFAVLACTGMRPGELLGLEWSAFDPVKKTVRVYQAVTREYAQIRDLNKAAKSRSVLSVPKSEYSTRELRLSDTAVEALCAWKKELRVSGSRARARSRFIFPGRGGKFRSLSGCEALLQRYRRDCGMERRHITFYKFRHTMCTRLVLDRQPINVIQRILGDNSPDVITKIYTHVEQADALRAADSFYRAMDQASQRQ